MVALLLFLVPMKNSHSHLLNKKFLLIFSFGFVFLYVVAAVVFGLTFHNIGYPVWCWNVLQWLCILDSWFPDLHGNKFTR